MAKVIFVIGANATGKTHFIERHYGKTEINILNVYDYQQRAYDEVGMNAMIPFDIQYKCLMKANLQLLEDILKKLRQGQDVVVEQTFYKAKRRIAYIDEIRKIPEVTIECFVMCPSDDLWEANAAKRNMNVHKEQRNALEFPNAAEGFDAIYEVADEEIRLRMDPSRPEIVGQARAELGQECEEMQLQEEEKRRKKELIESMTVRRLWHYCEVCGKKELITADEAFDTGWDYPPQMGQFGMLGPRTCGACHMQDTLFWKINTNSSFPIVNEKNLSPEELITWRRIKKEPESLLEDEEA